MTPDGSILPLKTISRSNSFIIEPGSYRLCCKSPIQFLYNYAVVTNEVERDKSSVQVNDSSTSLDTVRMQRSRRAVSSSYCIMSFLLRTGIGKSLVFQFTILLDAEFTCI